ncbi:MAG TPA: hypothetical protein VGL19_16435, partial [Polyangiaceae bacterium]
MSIGPVPLSFAVTGPLAQVFGVRLLLLLAGVTAAATMLLFLALPGVKDPDSTALESGDHCHRPPEWALSA